MNTFILNTISAGAFFVFLFIGLHFVFFRKSRIQLHHYRIFSGVAIILLAIYTLFIDIETQIPTIESVNTARLILIVVSFIVVMATVCYMLIARKDKQTDVPEVNNFIETPIINSNVQQTVQTVEQPIIIPSEQPKEQNQEPQKLEPSEPSESQNLETPEPQNPETSEPLNLETSEPHNLETLEPSEPQNPETSEPDTDDETKNEEVAPIDNASIDDLIFFQKVEALMASKRLFCEQDISREQIAFAIGTNRTYLARSIKNATGKTFLEYITDLRTSYAATLLTTTDEPLDVIGTISGFGSKSAYYRAFSAAFGCSPSEYRKR